MSRARGKPVPGAKHWPLALRSNQHPYGLPVLRRPERMGDRGKVENGNALASITFSDAAAAHKAGKGFAIENPTNSFIWVLDEALQLARLPDVFRVEFCNCMFRGGQRDKHTAVLTNVPEIRDALANKMCRSRDICERTGMAHLGWVPEVANGVIVKYMTTDEAGYPVGLCDAVGAAVWKRLEQRGGSACGVDTVFTEVFSGPRALLSARVARHVAVGLAGSSSSSSS